MTFCGLVTGEEALPKGLGEGGSWELVMDAQEQRFALPGLQERWVPQGLQGMADGSFLLSSYQSMHRSSPLIPAALRWSSDGPTRLSRLFADGQSQHYPLVYPGQRQDWHAGGVAYVHGQVFIADGHAVYSGPLPEEAGPITLRKAIDNHPFRSSCLSIDDQGRLWVGEFVHRASLRYGLNREKDALGFPQKLTNSQGEDRWAVIAVYTSPEGDLQALISAPERLQGMAIDQDLVWLSLSYGRNNPSQLRAYRNPLIHQQPAKHLAWDGKSVPLYHLDKQLLKQDVPPMSEEIWFDPQSQSLWVVFENAAIKFANGRGPKIPHLTRWQVQAIKDD
ncbi:MAG: hypothetical protein EA402_01275 [Planctomycetota bacterium]|nr:MAG: hypothetical protein EA402_01275 [Planctomycetota bacterium]